MVSVSGVRGGRRTGADLVDERRVFSVGEGADLGDVRDHEPDDALGHDVRDAVADLDPDFALGTAGGVRRRRRTEHTTRSVSQGHAGTRQRPERPEEGPRGQHAGEANVKVC